MLAIVSAFNSPTYKSIARPFVGAFLGLTGLSLALEPIVVISGIHIICLFMFLLFGTARTLFNIQFLSYIQISVAEDYLGRVFSSTFTVTVLFMPIGSFVFSFLCDTSRDISFAIVGGDIVKLSIISYFLIGKRRRPR